MERRWLVPDPLVFVAGLTLAACSIGPEHDPDVLQSPDSERPAGPQPTSPATTPPEKPEATKIFDAMKLVPAYTEHLGQLTNTATTPLAAGMAGTDLGSSFVRDGKLVFLFGDTLIGDPALRDADTFAFADPNPQAGVPALTWPTLNGSLPKTLKLPGIALGAYEVPVDGFALGADSYVFFATKFDIAANRYGSSTLARAKGLALESLEVVHEVPSAHFVNVSTLVEGSDIYIYGSGKEYRESQIYLAKVPATQIGDRFAWRYRDANGAWVESEASAAPVLPNAPACVGELSVKKHEKHALWFMTYGCGAEPRGVQLHISASPTGPWSKAFKIYGPEGYERVMHAKESYVGHDDGLAPPGNEEDWGGEYGPYLVPSLFVEDGKSIGITYVLSSWVPYQVHLMRTWLVPEGTTKEKPNPGAGKTSALVNPSFATGDFSGWQTSGDAFVVFPYNGTNAVSTYTPGKADAATGTLSQAFVVGETTTALEFRIHGGDGRVSLWRGNDRVRSSRARRNNDVETLVRWNLEEYRGETLRIVIEDDLTAPWGFVSARDFVFE